MGYLFKYLLINHASIKVSPTYNSPIILLLTMEIFTHQLQADLDQALHQIALGSHNPLERSLASLQVIEKALWRLKEFITGYDFKSLKEEVHFFKKVKTAIIKEQIFYDQLLIVESNRPTDQKAGLKKYLRQMMKGIDLYFQANYVFYSYYKMGRQDLDEQLFVRQAAPVPSLIPAARPDLDARFGNPYSLKLAKILAYEQLAGYLADWLDYIHTGYQQAKAADLFWSGTDSQFVELILALHSRGVINHGEISYSQLAEKLGDRLGFKTRNIHQVVKNIRGRKKDRTVFLRQLIESAEKKMDETDDF